MASYSDTAVVTGMAAVGAALETLKLAMKEKIARKAMLAATQVGLAAIQTEEPIRTGNMFRYTRIARRNDGITETQIQYIIFVKSGGKVGKKGTLKRGKGGPSQPSGIELPYYWFFVEFGTSKMQAQPFMLRGFMKSADNAAQRARDVAAAELFANLPAVNFSGIWGG